MNESARHVPQPSALMIVGAGRGVGAAVARRFAADVGGPVALVARDAGRLGALADELRGSGIDVQTATADITDHDGLRAAVDELGSRVGPIGTLCFSPLPRVDLIKPLRETTADDLMAALALSVGGAQVATQAVVPQMIARGSGAVLFTTGSAAVYPSAQRAASAVQTTAERSLIELLAEELAGTGVQVRHLTIAGAVAEDGAHTPEAVANALWALASGDDVAALLQH